MIILNENNIKLFENDVFMNKMWNEGSSRFKIEARFFS